MGSVGSVGGMGGVGGVGGVGGMGGMGGVGGVRLGVTSLFESRGSCRRWWRQGDRISLCVAGHPSSFGVAHRVG